MNERSEVQSREFNTRAEIGARLTYLLFLSTTAFGFIGVALGTLLSDVAFLAAGAAAFGIAFICRRWLNANDRLQMIAWSLDTFATGEPSVDDEHVRKLVKLLKQCSVLERKRGSSEFDPWALQSLRHAIQMEVNANPSLARLLPR